MNNYRSLYTIGPKIEKLKTALFFDFSDSFMKLPANIITIDAIEGSEIIWFSVKKPYKDIGGIDSIFFARLQFYNRNFNYYINVEGIATIQEINDNFSSRYKTDSREVQIKLEISNADYYCSQKRRYNILKYLWERAGNMLELNTGRLLHNWAKYG